MSIAMPDSSPTPALSPSKHRSKPKKKDKSSPEKKRKRHHEDGERSKSKKHRSEKPASERIEDSPSEEAPTSSPFHVQTSSLYLPLAPVSQQHPIEGLCAEHISPLILTYYPPFSGVILSYHDPRLSARAFKNDSETVRLQNIDDYAVSWGWLTAEFLLFKLTKGEWLEGNVNLMNEGHLGLVCWNLFNASVERRRLPADWRWVDGLSSNGWTDLAAMDTGSEDGNGGYAQDGLGYWVDGRGKKIEGKVRFKVREMESSHDRERGFLSIEGTMLDDEAERQLEESERDMMSGGREGARRRLGGERSLGATSLGLALEPGMEGDNSAHKHRHKY